MSNIQDIGSLKKDFEAEETKKFIEAQHKTIATLISKNKSLEQEILELKQLIYQPTTSVVIVTPEQALIDTQIEIIQNRSYLQELSLEDVKKLDLLLKNKFLIKRDDPKDIEAKPRAKLTQSQLLQIAAQHES